MVYVSLWKISSIFAVIVFGIMDMNCITPHNIIDMNLKQFTVSMLGQEVKFGMFKKTGIVVGYMEPVPGNDHLSFLGVILAFPDNRGYALSEIGDCTILLDLPTSMSFMHVQVNSLITR